MLAPLQTQSTLVGCLCLGPKRSGEPFRGEDEDLLLTLSGHLAATLRHLQLADELRAQVCLLDLLNARLQQAQEEERGRLAVEIHNEPLQTALHLQRLIASDGYGRAATAQQLAVAEMVVTQLRAVCQGVRPPALDEMGLAAALEMLAVDLGEHAGIPITLDADPALVDVPLAPEAELMLYRAAQEALNNALRHAHASALQITLHPQARAVVLRVIDDGRGFEATSSPRGLLAAGHLGLSGLQQRVARCGGCLQVTSSPGRGTVVQVFLPVPGARP
jgi:signal transduction histidine kinase